MLCISFAVAQGLVLFTRGSWCKTAAGHCQAVPTSSLALHHDVIQLMSGTKLNDRLRPSRSQTRSAPSLAFVIEALFGVSAVTLSHVYVTKCCPPTGLGHLHLKNSVCNMKRGVLPHCRALGLTLGLPHGLLSTEKIGRSTLAQGLSVAAGFAGPSVTLISRGSSVTVGCCCGGLGRASGGLSRRPSGGLSCGLSGRVSMERTTCPL